MSWPNAWPTVSLLLIVVLGGCTLGPNYTPPKAPTDNAYRIHARTAGNNQARDKAQITQVFDRAGQVRAEWYRVFGSHKLDTLIGRALKDSPTLAAGQARIKAAREAVRANKGALFPQINASAGISRQRVTGVQFGTQQASFINIFNLYQGQISASYDLDLFGKTRRRIEASQAQLDEYRYRVLNTYVTLINNIVATAIAEAGIDASLKATTKIARTQQHTLDIVRKQIQYGAAIKADASQIQAQLARTRASLEPLRKQHALAVNRLAVLVGATPGTFSDPKFSLDDLNLPKHLPVSLPAQLVHQRPDLLAAASAVHVASARIGVAAANLLPDVSITGYYGRSGLTFSDLGDPINALYSIGAQLAAPIFAGGRLRAQKRAAQDEYVAALADYRATALNAFGEVADSLRALESDARALQEQQTALDAAQNNLRTVRTQVNSGTADYVTLYTAESQYQKALLGYTNARVTRYRDSAELFRALGGGWWNSQQSLPGAPKPRTTTAAVRS